MLFKKRGMINRIREPKGRWGMGNIDFFEMTIRTTGAFFSLLILTRLLGKEQMSQLTFFNYITGITIGSIAADIASQSETPFFNGLISLVWWSGLTFLVSYLGMKFAKFRSITDGRPTFVIKEGKIMEKELSKLRLNLDELNMLLRQKEVFSIEDVDYAIFESDGQLSVRLKESKKPLTKGDQGKRVIQPRYLPTAVITDGIVQLKQLQGMGFSETWLKRQLEQCSLQIEDVFYAEMKSDGTLHIATYEESGGS